MNVRVLTLLVTASLIYGSPQSGSLVPGDINPGYRVRVDVDMVVLPATVRDRKGAFVSGLRKEDFQAFEDGAPQEIRLFGHEDVPVAVGLVVDNSGSMRRKRADVAAAALAFVRRSNPEDQMFVVNFNDRVQVGLPDTRLFSADNAELGRALSMASTGGKTDLYDAIAVGLEHLEKATRDKKVLIVISDGGDNASRHTLDQVIKVVQRNDAIIYTVGLFDEYDTDRNPKVLTRFARLTGGQAFFPEEASAVVRICERIAEDIRNQYTIGYVPTRGKLDGSYRAIKVSASERRHGKLSVRTRKGYIAVPNQAMEGAR